MQKIWMVVFLFPYLSSKGQTITTIAGKYIPPFQGYSGDGGLATNALFAQPVNICIDSKNNFYISDQVNNVVRKIDASGIITTYVGTGVRGYSGDGGPASQARLYTPSCVEVDKKDNLYITDTYNHVVRKVNPQGIITTFAGNGSSGYSGDGGLAINAQLDHPSGLAIDSLGNIFISDFDLNVIRKVDTAGIIRAIAGDNIPGYSGDGGPALKAHIWNVCLMSLDKRGNLYFADRGNQVIRKISFNTGIIETVAGTGVVGTYGDGVLATTAQLNEPYGICFDSFNNLYIADTHNNWIRMLDTSGIIRTIAGTGKQGYSGDGGPPLKAQLGTPTGVMADKDGSLYIVEAANNTVRKITFCKKVQILQTVFKDWGCEGDNAILYTNASSAVSYSWQWNDSGSLLWKDVGSYSGFSGSSKDSLSIFPLTQTMNGLRLRCVASNACSVDSTKGMPLHVYLKDTPITIITSAHKICANQKTTFKVNPYDTASYIQYHWQINGQTVQEGGQQFTTSILRDLDQVRCIRFNNGPCALSGQNQSNTVEVSVSNNPPPDFFVEPSVLEACQGTPVRFQVVGTGLTDTASYQWFVNGKAQSSLGVQFIDSTLQESPIINCIVSQGCFQDSLAKGVTMEIFPVPQVQINTTSSWIYLGDSIQLQGSIQGAYSRFSWSPVTTLNNPLILQPMIRPTQNTSYELMAETDKGCKSKSEISIKVFYPLQMPDSFTPNGDGINDLFRIPSNVKVDLVQFSIFDRWGNRVFTTGNSGDGWDGSFRGKKCPEGTYVYLIQAKEKGRTVPFKGVITLIR